MKVRKEEDDKFSSEKRKRKIDVIALSVESDYFCRIFVKHFEGSELLIEYQRQWRSFDGGKLEVEKHRNVEEKKKTQLIQFRTLNSGMVDN